MPQNFLTVYDDDIVTESVRPITDPHLHAVLIEMKTFAHQACLIYLFITVRGCTKHEEIFPKEHLVLPSARFLPVPCR